MLRMFKDVFHALYTKPLTSGQLLRFISTKPSKGKSLAHVTHDVTPVQPKLKYHKRNQKKLDVDQFNQRNDLVRNYNVPDNNYFKLFLTGFWEADGNALWDLRTNDIGDFIIGQNDRELLLWIKNLGLTKADDPLGQVKFRSKNLYQEDSFRKKINKHSWEWRIRRNTRNLMRMAEIVNNRISSPKKLKEYQSWFLEWYRNEDFKKQVPKNFRLQTKPREISLDEPILAGLFSADGSFSISIDDAGTAKATMSLAAQENLGLLLNCQQSLNIGTFHNPSAARDGLWSKNQAWRVKDKQSLQLLIPYFNRFLSGKKLISFKKFVFVLNLIWEKYDSEVIRQLIPFINDKDYIFIHDLSDRCYKAVRALPVHFPEPDIIIFGDPETDEDEAFIFEPRTEDISKINWKTKQGANFAGFKPKEVSLVWHNQLLPWDQRGKK